MELDEEGGGGGLFGRKGKVSLPEISISDGSDFWDLMPCIPVDV